MSLSLDVEYGVLAKQNLGNGYVNAIKLSSNLEKIVSAINDISSAVKTNIVVRSVNDQLPQNETNDINLNILRPDKNETDVYKEILSSEYQFMQESSEVSFQATEIGKKEFSAGGYKIQSILVDDNKILAGSNGNGIFYSEDNGETFEQATFEQAAGLELNQSINVIKKFFGKYFAGTGNSVYQSTDGKNWTIFTNKVGKNAYQISEKVNDLLQVKYGNRKILIAATDNGVVAVTNSYAKKTLIGGTAYALTKDDKNNVYFSANGNIYVISIEEINNYLIINYLTAADDKKSTEENSEIQESDLHEFKFGSNVYDMLIKDETLFAAVSYTVEDNSRIRSITTKYGIKKAPLSDLSQQSFTSIQGIGQKISYLKTNGYGIYTQIKNGSYPTFWFTTNDQDFTSYQTKLNDDISEFDFIDNFTMVAGGNGGIIKFKQTADYIRDKLITEIDLLANNEQLCTYINEQDIETYISAHNYTSAEIDKLDKDISDRISSEIDYIKNNTLSSYEQISTFTQGYISLGKNTYDNDANKQNNNVAIGKDVAVTEKDSIGLGQNISATGSNNIAIGNNLSTSNTNAIAIGYNLTSVPNEGEHSMAIGYEAAALCADSIAIGRMISTETSSTTKIGAAFRNASDLYENAETIALELCANIKNNGDSASKAYITTNRFTKNTGTNTGKWTETKKEISLEGHTHASSDIIGLSDEFISYDNKIEYISSYVYTISNDVEKISVDLYSLSSQTSSISTQLCAEILDLSTNIDSQKVTEVTSLDGYTKDGVLSSDTVKFPTAAAITQWADNKYAVKADIESLSTQLGLVKNDLQKTQGLVYEVYIAPDNTDNFIKNDDDFNSYKSNNAINGDIPVGNDDNYNIQLNIALSSIDAKTVYDYYNNENNGAQNRTELSVPFLKDLKDHINSSTPTILTAITTTDIETFRTHRQRQVPLFTLTRACDFLANFRAKGNTSYFINCVPGVYYYGEVQRIQNPDCSLQSRNLLTICRIDSLRYNSGGRKFSYTFKNYNKDSNGNFNFEKCIEFNFYKRLLYIFKSKISDYPVLIGIYCYTQLQNIRVSSGLNNPEILSLINNGKLNFGNEFVEYTRWTYKDENEIEKPALSGYIPAGNAISSNTVIENDISIVKDIVYRPSNSADGTLKYTYDNSAAKYFKTYGLFIYSTNVELDFVCFDRLSHGFNCQQANITTWSIKFVGCAMGINAQLQSSINFYFKSRLNSIRGACVIDIGYLGCLCQVNDNSYININYIPEVLEYTTNPPTGVDPNKVGIDLSCTPKYVFKGAFVDRGFYNFARPNCGIFKLRANSTNTVTDGAGLNGLTREEVFNAGTDIEELSVISLRYNSGIWYDNDTKNTHLSTIEKMKEDGTISSTDGYIFRKFYDAQSDNALELSAKLSASTDRYFMFYCIGDDNGYRAPIFNGEDYKDVYLRKLFNGQTIASSDFYAYTYDAMYYHMNAIHAVPSAPLAL